MKKIWKTEKREYRRNKTHKKKPTDLLHDKITVFQKKKKSVVRLQNKKLRVGFREQQFTTAKN